MGAREMGKYFWEEPTELGDWGLHVLPALLVFALGNKIEKAVPETKRETQKKRQKKRRGRQCKQNSRLCKTRAIQSSRARHEEGLPIFTSMSAIRIIPIQGDVYHEASSLNTFFPMFQLSLRP